MGSLRAHGGLHRTVASVRSRDSLGCLATAYMGRKPPFEPVGPHPLLSAGMCQAFTNAVCSACLMLALRPQHTMADGNGAGVSLPPNARRPRSMNTSACPATSWCHQRVSHLAGTSATTNSACPFSTDVRHFVVQRLIVPPYGGLQHTRPNQSFDRPSSASVKCTRARTGAVRRSEVGEHGSNENGPPFTAYSFSMNSGGVDQVWLTLSAAVSVQKIGVQSVNGRR